MGASDIHIESFRDSAQTRFRVDGILKVIDKYSKFLHENYDAVIARVKIISKLDIAERRVPQDGASTFNSYLRISNGIERRLKCCEICSI